VAEGLIIVESPAKARTLKRFLGDRFDVRASMGHVRDLPERELAVDVEASFQPRYEVVEGRKQTITDLRKAVRGQREVILASDPDREGEAIAWHLAEVLRLREPKRIEFHEITNEAVRRALDSPREIDMRLVNAQQARRIVDRLVGYRLSPFLWSKVQKGIGAGRVSSVALRLVVEGRGDCHAVYVDNLVDAFLLAAEHPKAVGDVRAGKCGVAGADGDEAPLPPLVGERQRCGEESPHLEAAGGLQQLQLEPAAIVERQQGCAPEEGPGPLGSGAHLGERDHSDRTWCAASISSPRPRSSRAKIRNSAIRTGRRLNRSSTLEC